MILNRLKNNFKKCPTIYSLARLINTPIRNFKTKKIRKKYEKIGIRKLNEVSNHETNKIIYYFGIPIHKNMGDLAQYYCINRWLKNNYPETNIVQLETYCTYSKKFIRLLENKVNKDDILIFQSGYCSKESHLDHKMHCIIVKNFKKNKIVFFPQTVNFVNKYYLKKTANIYNKHDHLLFLARDKESYKIANKYFNKVKVDLFPDIVTTLIGDFNISNKNKEGLFFCLRNDGEKKFSINDFIAFDVLKNKYQFVDKGDTNSNLKYSEIVKDLNSNISMILEKFSKYKLIITDRYHGTIFSMIANTKVIVVPTNDHKVVSGATWFKGIYDSYRVVENPAEAIRIAKAMTDFEVNNKEYFNTNYYSKLKNMIENL